MLEAVKRYARKVLLFHALLLLVVALVVLGAARSVYHSARSQAIKQSGQRLDLLAEQTSRGIANYYLSIMSDLEAFLREEADTSTSTTGTTTSSSAAETAPNSAANPLSRETPESVRQFLRTHPPIVDQRGMAFMWRQLQGRVSHLFVVDNDTGRVVMSFPQRTKGAADIIAKDHLDWFRSIKETSLSHLQRPTAGERPELVTGDYHLIAVPTAGLEMRRPDANRNADQPAPNGSAQNRGFNGYPNDNPGQPQDSEMGPGQFPPPGGPGPDGQGMAGPGGAPAGGPGMGDPMGPPGMGGPPDMPPPGIQGPGDNERPQRPFERNGFGFRRRPGANNRRQGEPAAPAGRSFNMNGRTVQIRARTLVAVVPVSVVKQRFFDSLNDQGVVHADLLDDTGTVLVSIDPRVTGTNILANLPPSAARSMQPLLDAQSSGTVVIPQAYSVAGVSVGSRIIAFRPITQLPGKKWSILVSSPISEAETVVKGLFGEAIIWALFVTLSIAGILGSTSFFMIRSRVRFEQARNEVITRELEQARRIQLAWLPDAKNTPAGLEVSAANLPASHISGDFYNWFHLPAPTYSRHTASHPDAAPDSDAPSSRVAVVIGDVTGHGMAAAFLMATTQLLVRTTLLRYQDPGRCLQEVNRQLCMQDFRGQFVTMLVLILDPRSNTLEIATAGHPAPLVERDGRFAPLDMQPQLVLGVDPNEQYRTEGFVLDPGASVLLYTDGVVEAEADGGEQYGVERLIKLLSNTRNGSHPDPQARIHAVLEDVKRFCSHRDLADDLTLVALRTTDVSVEVSTQLAT